MKYVIFIFFAVILYSGVVFSADSAWYTGDERCPPPKDDGTYSAPYNALDHRHEYPAFSDADKPGWSCSYQREDGTIVQYGDNRSPQQQWSALWGNSRED